MVELVDTEDSKSFAFNGMLVQFRLEVYMYLTLFTIFLHFFFLTYEHCNYWCWSF